MLNVEGINTFRGELHILWDVSLKVEKGEIVTVIGPNGAGKTTLLHSIIGLINPRDGSIKFMGHRLDNLPIHKIVNLGISLVPEGRRLFPKFSVSDNLYLAALTPLAKERKSHSLEFVFELFPILKERKNQLASSLSGGEQQMLAIARGLMSNPNLLMLDEPSQGLAPKIMLDLFETIAKIKEEGITVLLVEQNVYMALDVADRGYLLENGKIVLEDDAGNLSKNEHIKKFYLGL